MFREDVTLTEIPWDGGDQGWWLVYVKPRGCFGPGTSSLVQGQVLRIVTRIGRKERQAERGAAILVERAHRKLVCWSVLFLLSSVLLDKTR